MGQYVELTTTRYPYRVSLRLYDTLTRTAREFVPREPGKVGIYLCGVTVQAEPHIGHLRSGVSYDVLRRWLGYLGYQVTFVRNITDIDDRVLARSIDEGVPWWALAYHNERILADCYATLGVLPPTYEPRATGHIPEILSLIDVLIERGHAYRGLGGNGDVYFDVRSFPEYGALSRQQVDHMQAAEDGESRAKRDPRDFALWKAYKPTEPADAQWATPYGPGRPGWHIECSAMARRYLGDEFDIHGGGVDLVFPHHENEIAQSRAAGFGFARHWMHNGLLNHAGEKMSKSIGNVVYLRTLIDLGLRPVEIRYYLALPHYRSLIEYSEPAIREAAAAYQRIENFVQRANERVGQVTPTELPPEFVAAMNDDLNTPKAIAVVHDVVRDGNAALADGDDTSVREALAKVRGMLDLLGLDPLQAPWVSDTRGSREKELRAVVERLVTSTLEQREQARARRDYATADALRDQLKQAGILVEDSPRGPRWTLAEGAM